MTASIDNRLQKATRGEARKAGGLGGEAVYSFYRVRVDELSGVCVMQQASTGRRKRSHRAQVMGGGRSVTCPATWLNQ